MARDGDAVSADRRSEISCDAAADWGGTPERRPPISILRKIRGA